MDELVAAIEDDPADAENFRVYGDWLERNGDPRGQLIAMQLLLETLTDRAKREHLEERIARYFDRHRAAFAPELVATLSTRTLLQNWCRGFQHSLVLTTTSGEDRTRCELLAELFAHPSGRFLVDLALAIQDPYGQPSIDAVARAAPRALRSLVMRVPTADVDALWPRVPRLRKLELRAWESATLSAPPELSELERLVVALPGSAAETILSGRFPALRELRIHCRDLSPRNLQPLLDLATLPALSELALVECSFTAGLAHDLLATPLATRPLARIRLERCALGPRAFAQLRTIARDVVHS